MATDEESTKKYPLESITKCIKIGDLQKKNNRIHSFNGAENKLNHKKIPLYAIQGHTRDELYFSMARRELGNSLYAIEKGETRLS